MADEPIKVGGPYQEREDFVPDPTNMVKQFNTSGVGAHNKIEEVSNVFEVDRVKVAQEIKGALDPEDDTVDTSRVLLPEATVSNEAAEKDILRRADKRLEKGVVIGEATPAEREAEKKGEEGVRAAVAQERENAEANSTGGTNAGQHDPGVSTSDSADAAKAEEEQKAAAAKKAAPAKKAASSTNK